MSANGRKMTYTKEFYVGLVFLVCAAAIIALATGWAGLLSIAIMILLASVALHLFNKKSLLAKTGAVFIFGELLFKLLMPRSSRLAIKELEEAETKDSANQ